MGPRPNQRSSTARAGREAQAPRARRTLTEQAYRAIEEQIVTLRLEPGDMLSEQMLSATFKIGRTPIREALQRLAHEGLVTILPRKGILVSDINPRNQLLVLEVRRELERLLSRASAERATAEQRAQFQDIARGMDRAAKTNDDIAFMRLDRELNPLIIEAAHNDYAARSMRLLQGLSRRFWYMHYSEAADLPLCARLHAAQARAIAEGDAKAAAATTIDYTRASPARRFQHRICAAGGNIADISVSVRECGRPTRVSANRWSGGDGRRPAAPSATTSSIHHIRLSNGPTRATVRSSSRWRSFRSPRRQGRALALSEPFMKRIVANLDNDWTLTSAEIDAALKEIDLT